LFGKSKSSSLKRRVRGGNMNVVKEEGGVAFRGDITG
jgi:hypothetical protein